MTLYSLLIYMLLSEDVTYASNVFGTHINKILRKQMLFSLIGFEIQTCSIIYEPICNIISATTLRM